MALRLGEKLSDFLKRPQDVFNTGHHCFPVCSVILNANVSWNHNILLFILLHLVGSVREASSGAVTPPTTTPSMVVHGPVKRQS